MFIFPLKIYVKMLERKNEWRVKREARNEIKTGRSLGKS